jgi:hypothetical protein
MLPVLSVILYLECHLFRRVWVHLGCAEAGIQIDFLPSRCNMVLSALCLAFLHVPLKLSSVSGAIDLLWVFCFLLLSMDANQPTRGSKRAGIIFCYSSFGCVSCSILYVWWCFLRAMRVPRAKVHCFVAPNLIEPKL